MNDLDLRAKQFEIVGIRFALVSHDEVMSVILRCRDEGERIYITQTPPYSVWMCRHDPELLKATDGAYLTLPDGVGIIVAANLLRYPHHGRVSGPELMLSLCEAGRKFGLRHYFYGGAEGVAERLSGELSNMYPGLQVVGTYCPPFRPLSDEEDRAIVDGINSVNPDIVWVGLGSPKQEKWMAGHNDRINATVMIGVGAAFDFHSGNVKWAPAWVRRLGLESIYRILQEPRRVPPRLVGDFVFGIRVVAQAIARWLPGGT